MLRLVLLASLTAMVATADAATYPGASHAWLTEHPTIQRLLALTNQRRAQVGLPPVRLNPEMCLAAQRHATWMSSTGVLQHSGLPYREIIFNGPRTPEDAINGWIYSPAHHGIMISHATEVGFGYTNRGVTPAWVGVFR